MSSKVLYKMTSLVTALVLLLGMGLPAPGFVAPRAVLAQEPDPLALFYTFDEPGDGSSTSAPIHDTSGNDYDGTVQETDQPNELRAGHTGFSFYFGGGRSYIAANTYPAISGDFTIMFWVKPDTQILDEYPLSNAYRGLYDHTNNMLTSNSRLVSIGYISPEAAHGSDPNGGQLALGEGADASYVPQYIPVGDQTNRIDDGEFHHVAVVGAVGSADYGFYIDGAHVVTVTSSVAAQAPTSPLRLGTATLNSSTIFGPFRGDMDEVQTYDYKWPAEEIAKLFVDSPTAPTDGTATAISSTQIDVSWTDNSDNEESFVIEWSATSGGPYTEIVEATADQAGTGVSQTYNHTGLTCETPYYYRVSARNADGDSTPTDEFTATTLACGGGDDGDCLATADDGGTVYSSTDSRPSAMRLQPPAVATRSRSPAPALAWIAATLPASQG